MKGLKPCELTSDIVAYVKASNRRISLSADIKFDINVTQQGVPTSTLAAFKRGKLHYFCKEVKMVFKSTKLIHTNILKSYKNLFEF